MTGRYPPKNQKSPRANGVEVRRGLCKALVDADVDRVTDVAQFIIEKLKRAQ